MWNEVLKTDSEQKLREYASEVICLQSQYNTDCIEYLFETSQNSCLHFDLIIMKTSLSIIEASLLKSKKYLNTEVRDRLMKLIEGKHKLSSIILKVLYICFLSSDDLDFNDVSDTYFTKIQLKVPFEEMKSFIESGLQEGRSVSIIKLSLELLLGATKIENEVVLTQNITENILKIWNFSEKNDSNKIIITEILRNIIEGKSCDSKRELLFNLKDDCMKLDKFILDSISKLIVNGEENVEIFVYSASIICKFLGYDNYELKILAIDTFQSLLHKPQTITMFELILELKKERDFYSCDQILSFLEICLQDKDKIVAQLAAQVLEQVFYSETFRRNETIQAFSKITNENPDPLCGVNIIAVRTIFIYLLTRNEVSQVLNQKKFFSRLNSDNFNFEANEYDKYLLFCSFLIDDKSIVEIHSARANITNKGVISLWIQYYPYNTIKILISLFDKLKQENESRFQTVNGISFKIQVRNWIEIDYGLKIY